MSGEKDIPIEPEKRDGATPEAPSELSREDDDAGTNNEGTEKIVAAKSDPVPRGGLNDVILCELGGVLPEPQSPQTPAPPRDPGIVLRADRRGLLASLAVIPEVERPKEYTNRVKWIITFFTAVAGAAAPMGSAIFYPALPEMTKEFGVSATLVNLAIALYMLAMSIFPLWWSSFSETLGRRNMYVISFFLNILFCLLSALSVNIAMLIVFRMLSGGASASVQAVGAGTIADIWEPRERGRAMGIFYLGPLMGPMLGPVLGGILAQYYGWRSTAYFLTVYGVIVFVLTLFVLPETLERRKLSPPSPPPTGPTAAADDNANLSRVTSTARSVQTRSKKAAKELKRWLVDPLEIITYLRFPPVLCSVYYSAITFGSLYVLNIAVQSSFSRAPYGFDSVILGLLYLPGSVGYAVTSILGGRWIDKIMIRAAERAERRNEDGALVLLPEDRMGINAWIAASLYPASLVWFGWAAQRGVHWAVPSAANFCFGLSSMLIFSAVTTMLTEFMPRRSSSGVALNNFVRNILSCTGGVVGQPLIDAMGVGWLMTTLGLVCWISGNLTIWLLRRNSRKWRVQMDRALGDE